MTSKPTEPPRDGPAVELRPHGEKHRPNVTVYRHPRPALWIFWCGRWEYADVRARHDWTTTDDAGKQTHTVAYQVELTGSDNDGTRSRYSRTFLWGTDSVRAVEDHGDGHENVNSQS